MFIRLTWDGIHKNVSLESMSMSMRGVWSEKNNSEHVSRHVQKKNYFLHNPRPYMYMYSISVIF